jgi:hypothetical protein
MPMCARIALLVSLATAAAVTSARVEACGDKFLVISRSIRRARAAHPSSILIYANPASTTPAAVRELQIERNLKLAGHQTMVVADAHALDQALSSGQYDLVLSDPKDAAALRAQFDGALSRPRVVPILLNATESEGAAAQRQFGPVIRAPGKSKALLGAIDAAMELRLREPASTAAKPR